MRLKYTLANLLLLTTVVALGARVHRDHVRFHELDMRFHELMRNSHGTRLCSLRLIALSSGSWICKWRWVG